jgi:hypothetical protein
MPRQGRIKGLSVYRTSVIRPRVRPHGADLAPQTTAHMMARRPRAGQAPGAQPSEPSSGQASPLSFQASAWRVTGQHA